MKNHTLPPDIESDLQPRFEVVNLTTPAAWSALYSRYTAGAVANFAPLRRCLGILSSAGVKTCVIEKHYVCLDYKSEILSFYSHLDAPQSAVATRLHFFTAEISDAEVIALSRPQVTSYRGYIVCRGGGLPLVGRTLITPPRAVKISAAVTERVHFFGQRLSVTGAPFMQQDSQLAVCSQVAVWTAHYSAYRRGITQRNFIAEIVQLSAELHPLRPHVSEGLRIWEVPALLEKAGLQSVPYYTPGNGDVAYPRINPAAIAVAADVLEKVKDHFSEEQLKVLRSADKDLGVYAGDLADLVDDRDIDEAARRLSTVLLDLIYAYMFAPYLKSRFPVYCATPSHAFALVGLGTFGDAPLFFMHDDQYGPYLATPSLRECSRDVLRAQSSDSTTFEDRSRLNHLRQFVKDYDDIVYAVTSFIVPVPNRLVLSPTLADSEARALVQDEGGPWETNVTIMMGIDFKEQRCNYAKQQQDNGATSAYAGVHLAEWVVVVEGYEKGATKSSWEIVYDGSSGTVPCLIQMVRLNDKLIISQPSSRYVTEVIDIALTQMPLAVSPTRVGKVS